MSPVSLPCSSSDATPVEQVSRLLRSAGWSVRVLALTCAGEDDVRLCVTHHDGGQPEVELLCATDDLPALAHWTAVRVVRGARTVWQGPPTCADPGLAIRFVEDLLLLDPERLRRRHRRLG